MAVLGVSGGTTDLATIAPEYGFGNDIIGVLSGNNIIYTYEGNDIVYTLRASLITLQNVYLGFGNDSFFGGDGVDSVRDGAGNDYCSLGSGNDTQYGGFGNDVFAGGAGTDLISYQLLFNDDGTSSLNSFAVVIDLAKTTAQNTGVFGIDSFSGFENVLGGNGNDRIYGNAVANTFQGLNGHDILDGRGGNDLIFGGEGADWLIGGRGKDSLVAAESVALLDRIRFLSVTDSSANPILSDEILNFDRGGLATDDRIDLSAIDANPLMAGNQAFVFRGGGAFTAVRGEVRLVVSGADTLVSVDTDTDAAPEMVIRVVGVTGLTAADFIL